MTTIMKHVIIALLLIITTDSFPQSNIFSIHNFPSTKFKITYDTTHMEDFKIVIIIASPVNNSTDEYPSKRIWVQRLGKEQKEKYLGETDTEYGVYIPEIQPLDNTFIIVQCSEFTGEINLITEKGSFITIPGYTYVLEDSHFMYTAQLRDTEVQEIACKFDLETKEATNLQGKNIPMPKLSSDVRMKWLGKD